MSNPYSQNDLTRAEELAFKRGFDAGVAHQKKAAPPPKARELAKQLEAARDAAAEAFDAALTAFGQVQERLAAVTAERDGLLTSPKRALTPEQAATLQREACADWLADTHVGTLWTPAWSAAVIEVRETPLVTDATPLETAVQASTEQERKHCRCGRLCATMNDYMSAPPDLRDDKRGLCWAEWTGEACR